MIPSSDKLRFRRAVLLRRGELQRQELRHHMTEIEAVADRIDWGLGKVRRIATPVLMAGGVLGALLLGRGRLRRALAGGLGLLGLFSRFGSTRRVLTQLVQGQVSRGEPVRRSR